MSECNIYIVAVPTPVINKKPDLRTTKDATKIIAKLLKKNDLVIYESTFYPGVTEEICSKYLEKISGLKLNEDFYLGYSPERINPGDKKRTLTKIKKITSGSSRKALNLVDSFYKSFVKAGTYRVESIKIAEAAKVIENTQRDLNIALINEFSIIFNKLKLDTKKILKAAETKWNFNKFEPGLVGGHCIGVDPYYLTYKSKKVGYKPELILAGRNLNDNYFKHIGKIALKELKNRKKLDILIVGFTFKENCTDIRNTKVYDLYKFFLNKGHFINVFDRIVNKRDVKKEYGINIINKIKKKYDLIIFAVKHDYLKKKDILYYRNYLNKNGKIFDMKNLFPYNEENITL